MWIERRQGPPERAFFVYPSASAAMVAERHPWTVALCGAWCQRLAMDAFDGRRRVAGSSFWILVRPLLRPLLEAARIGDSLEPGADSGGRGAKALDLWQESSPRMKTA